MYTRQQHEHRDGRTQTRGPHWGLRVPSFHPTSHHERVGTLVVDRGSNSQVVEDAGLVNVVQGGHVRNHLGVVGVRLTETLQDTNVGRRAVGGQQKWRSEQKRIHVLRKPLVTMPSTCKIRWARGHAWVTLNAAGAPRSYQIDSVRAHTDGSIRV